MGDYASKGVGGTALGVGIGALALSALNTSGNGILGLGGNSSKVDELQSEIAELKAEKYSNNVGIEVYKANAERDAKISTRFEELAREVADMRVREATLNGTIATNNATLQGQIASVANTANNGIAVLNANLTCLQNTVDGITKLYVPATSVTPTPMNLYNSWTAPTTTTTTSTTGA